MSSEEDRMKRRRRLHRNKYAQELRKRQYHQRIIKNKKKEELNEDAYEQD